MSKYIIGRLKKLISTTENGTIVIFQVNTDLGCHFFLRKCKRSPKMMLSIDIILKGVLFTEKTWIASLEAFQAVK